MPTRSCSLPPAFLSFSSLVFFFSFQRFFVLFSFFSYQQSTNHQVSALFSLRCRLLGCQTNANTFLLPPPGFLIFFFLGFLLFLSTFFRFIFLFLIPTINKPPGFSTLLTSLQAFRLSNQCQHVLAPSPRLSYLFLPWFSSFPFNVFSFYFPFSHTNNQQTTRFQHSSYFVAGF